MTRPNLIYDITTPSGKIIKPPENGWRWSKETVKEKISTGEIIFNKDETSIIRKIHLQNLDGRTPETIWFGKEFGTTRTASKQIKDLFNNQNIFETPKPLELLEKIMSLSMKNGDIVLDFFAGSSTTAHAVMALNAEDAEDGEAGKRKFIMVQIPEAIDAKDNQSAYDFCVDNNMPPNIAEISKERIRRAAAHITSELPESGDSKALDFGFKAYRLSESNFIPWQQPASYDADSLMAQLEKHLDPISDNATTDGIITELMLKEGYTLTATIDEADGYYLVTQTDALIDNFDADSSDNAGTSMRLAIVLDDMTTDKATQIIARAPNKTLIMDRAFSDDANKANIVLQFEDAGLVVGCV